MTYEAGAWKVCCDKCGGQFKNRQLRKEWTGVMACSGPGTNECWDRKHPQLAVKGKADRQAPPWVRPEPPEIDVSPGSGNQVSASSL